MSRRLDLDPLPLDGNTAERILSGSVPPADAPPGYAGVVRVLEAAARPPLPGEQAGEVEAVALITASLPTPRRSPVPTRKLTARLAALTLAGGLSLTSGLAAAGALPGRAQAAAADVLDTIGIDIPSSDDDAKASDGAGAERAGQARENKGTTAGKPDDAGRDGHPSGSTNDRDDNHGADVSDTAQSVDPGPGHGAAVCEVASDGRCQPDDDDQKFADQIDRCRERGREQRARFEEQGKEAQADAARERARECRDRFRELRDRAEDRPDAREDRTDARAERRDASSSKPRPADARDDVVGERPAQAENRGPESGPGRPSDRGPSADGKAERPAESTADENEDSRPGRR